LGGNCDAEERIFILAARAEGGGTIDANSTSGRRGNEPETDELPYSTLRVDLSSAKLDLIEEIPRLARVEKIAATAPRGASGSNPRCVHVEIGETVEFLTGPVLDGSARAGRSFLEPPHKSCNHDPVLLSNPPQQRNNEVLRPPPFGG